MKAEEKTWGKHNIQDPRKEMLSKREWLCGLDVTAGQVAEP